MSKVIESKARRKTADERSRTAKMRKTTASQRNRVAKERAEADVERVAGAACINADVLAAVEDWAESEGSVEALYAQIARSEIALRRAVAVNGGTPGVDIGPLYDGAYDGHINANRICWQLDHLPRSTRSLDGLTLLAVAVEGMGEALEHRHVVAPAVLGGKRPRLLVRSAGLLDVATFSALEVDGRPVATPSAIDGARLSQYRVLRPKKKPGELFAGPRTLSGEAIGEPVLRALASCELTGDERNPVRGDAYRVSLLGYALSGAALVSEEEGVALLTGKGVTDAGRRRWWKALALTKSLMLTVNEVTEQWVPLLNVDAALDGKARIEAPWWWRQQQIWRLTGALLRPALADQSERGTSLGYWGGLHRTVAGLESALSWSRTAGRGEDGRIPDLLRPEFGESGPGPEVFIPWWKVLALAGEHVNETADGKGSAGRRYRRRLAALESAGYFYTGRAPAEAGDTVEVRPVMGGRHRGVSGLMVRASAAMVEAVKKSQNPRSWIRLPAKRVLK